VVQLPLVLLLMPVLFHLMRSRTPKPPRDPSTIPPTPSDA
jgi:hypothetical protein